MNFTRQDFRSLSHPEEEKGAFLPQCECGHIKCSLFLQIVKQAKQQLDAMTEEEVRGVEEVNINIDFITNDDHGETHQGENRI